MAFLGCLAYLIYTITLYCDAPLQKYFHSFERQHFKDRDNTVKLTDVVFGIHGLVMMFAIILQIGIYEKGSQRLSRITAGLLGLNVPQVYLIASRRSTEKFSIPGVWLDFARGIFSIVQMLLYCVIDKDNAQLTGNVPKLLLSLVSLMFDVIFIFQHYICYRSRTLECLVNQES